jgi:hypothetical protein
MSSFNLLSLPTEMISRILSYLRPSEIERVARTYNKTVTEICLPLLRGRAATARNARKMVTLFGAPHGVNHFGPLVMNYALAGLSLEWGPFSAPALPPERQYTALEYLNLCGDLHWLAPLDRYIAKKIRVRKANYPETSREEMDKLQNASDKLGLRLPACFSRIMTERKLQNRIPFYLVHYFELNQLIKLRSSKVLQSEGFPDLRVDGYIIRFLRNHPAWQEQSSSEQFPKSDLIEVITGTFTSMPKEGSVC